MKRRNLRLKLRRLIRTSQNASIRLIIVLHGCAHNLTDIDPTPQENKTLIPLFDVAYLGFAAADAFSLHSIYTKSTLEKNFGLCGEPIEALHAARQEVPTDTKVMNQIK